MSHSGVRSTSSGPREPSSKRSSEQLSESVAALVTGEDWRRALSSPHSSASRSFNNTMLIYVQHFAAYSEGRVPEPTPTYVAGFQQWLSLGRHVDEGPVGYAILAPVTARFASSTPDDAELLAAPRPRREADVRRVRPLPADRRSSRPTSGTSPRPTGDPVPELPRPHTAPGPGTRRAVGRTGRPDHRRAASSCGWSPSAAAIGGANGLTDFLSREVSVRMDMDEAAQVKTLAHELGHVLLHAPRERPVDRVAADATCTAGSPRWKPRSVALMVGAAHGLDTSSYTVPYVSTWAASVPGKNPVEVVQSTAERVRATALGILDKLDTQQVGDGNPPGLDREALSHRTGHGACRHRRTARRGGARAMKIPVVLQRRPRRRSTPTACMAVDVDGDPHAVRRRRRTRGDLRAVIDEITADLGAPVRVEVREADGIDVRRHRDSPRIPGTSGGRSRHRTAASSGARWCRLPARRGGRARLRRRAPERRRRQATRRSTSRPRCWPQPAAGSCSSG